jgi:hypothetical protein
VLTVDAEKRELTRRAGSHRRALVGVYLASALIGYLLVSAGVVALPQAVSPLARVGFALREKSPEASAEAWARLGEDVAAVRSSWTGPEPAALDLVVAVRGLGNGGHPEWVKADELCHTLKWPRCDRLALEELARRSRP